MGKTINCPKCKHRIATLLHKQLELFQEVVGPPFTYFSTIAYIGKDRPEHGETNLKSEMNGWYCPQCEEKIFDSAEEAKGAFEKSDKK